MANKTEKQLQRATDAARSYAAKLRAAATTDAGVTGGTAFVGGALASKLDEYTGSKTKTDLAVAVGGAALATFGPKAARRSGEALLAGGMYSLGREAGLLAASMV